MGPNDSDKKPGKQPGDAGAKQSPLATPGIGEDRQPHAGARRRASNKVQVLTLPGSGGAQDRTFRLNKDRIVIGAVVSADVRLVGDGVAPLHAVIEVAREGTRGGVAMIYDLASDVGTFVNGKKTITQALETGDKLTVGPYTLVFGVEDVDKPRAPQRPERVRVSEGRKLFINPTDDIQSLLLQDERDVEEIFDYRGTSRSALEVVMSWKNTILAVEHFVDREKVTIGNGRGVDFGIPPLVSEAAYPLVTKSGGVSTLHLDAQMHGVLQREGGLVSLKNSARTVPFGEDDFAKISIGDVDFYLSFTQAPPRLKRRRLFEHDPLFLKIFSASLLLTAVTIVALLKAHVPQPLEAEQMPDRIATILYQPEKYAAKPKPEQPMVKAEKQVPAVKPPPPKEPTPVKTTKVDLTPNPANVKKPVPKELNTGASQTTPGAAAKNQQKAAQGQNQAKEGQGARAKGKEGTRGKKNAAAGKSPQDRASRPSPQGGTGRGASDSRVPDEGNIDFLKGAGSKIQNLLAGSGEKLGKGGEKLQGFGAFNTLGKGGLALSGDGKGGGGDAASLGGLSDKGRGGGRVGTGMGAAGTGNGIVGGKARVAIRTGGPEEAVVMGAIDADAVEAALLAHRDEFRLCYEKEINAEQPKLAGRVSTSFVIGSSGRVNQAGVESTTLKNANVERCILTVIKRIDFPIPRGGGIVQVTYPFKFSPTGR